MKNKDAQRTQAILGDVDEKASKKNPLSPNGGIPTRRIWLLTGITN
tara:strand:- start:115 stop:252 length:138 start_codon:yes stop_codon:yes gene_type:complete